MAQTSELMDGPLVAEIKTGTLFLGTSSQEKVQRDKDLLSQQYFAW